MDVVCKQNSDPAGLEKTYSQSREDKIIVCAACSTHITDPDKQIAVNDSFCHIFANPHGHVFEIGCFSGARGVKPASMPSSEFSWFIGYSWKIGVCHYCSTHLGWIFSSESDEFFGLILERLIFPCSGQI